MKEIILLLIGAFIGSAYTFVIMYVVWRSRLERSKKEIEKLEITIRMNQPML